MSVDVHLYSGDRGIWLLSGCRTGPFLRLMKKALFYTSCSSFSSFCNCSLSLVGCFFLGALCVEVQRCPGYPSNRSLCWRGTSSRQEESPSSLTLTLGCLSCLLTPDTSWGNTGTGARLVTSTYHISAESCVHPLLAHLCSVRCIWGFVLFPRFPMSLAQIFCC